MTTATQQPAVKATSFDSPTTFVGVALDNGLEQYRGIKFAHIRHRWARPAVLNDYTQLLGQPGILSGRVDNQASGLKYDATRFGPIAPQPAEDIHGYYSVPPEVARPMPADAVQDEFDLLNLVITKPSSTAEKLPVLVFIHGGSNATGSASNPLYSMASLVERSIATATASNGGKPVIAVQIQYRLGALGYMYVNEQGNWGLLDQKAALAWVNRHIGDWGGDPTNITAVGLSAGSCDLYYQTVMDLPVIEGQNAGSTENELGEEVPGAKLYKRAAFMSGVGATLPLRSVSGQQQLKRQIASELFPTDPSISSQPEPELDQLLSQAPLETIVRASLQPSKPDSTLVRIWHPTLDFRVIRTPDDSDADSGPTPPPPALSAVMLCDTKDEGALFTDMVKAMPDPDTVLAILTSTPAGTDLARAYNLTGNSGDLGEQFQRGMEDMLADCVFTYPIGRFARRLWGQSAGIAGNSAPAVPVYKLIFDAPNPFRPEQGSIHGTDMLYLMAAYLGPGGSSHIRDPAQARQASRALQDIYIRFCRSGSAWDLTTGEARQPEQAMHFSGDYGVNLIKGTSALGKLRRTVLDGVVERHGLQGVQDVFGLVLRG